jgi:hypothetical protein
MSREAEVGAPRVCDSAAATRERRAALERAGREAGRAGPRDRRGIERWAGQGIIGPRCGFGPISVFFFFSNSTMIHL